jgi:RHS repeat-associated protein
MAFHGVSVARSRRLLVEDFGLVLAGVSANPAVSVASKGRIVRYLSDYRAVVRTSHGLRVETSTAPLRVADGGGVKRPVDLGLRADAEGFAPVRPLAALSIAGSLDGGVGVGSEGLRVRMEGADVRGNSLGQSVFFGDAGPDVDAVVTPTLGGVDLSAVLRSSVSPEQLRYRLALPAGARLRSAGEGAVVLLGGRVLARVRAPSARDAHGSEVPVVMGVVGDELVLTVSDRGRGMAYPVLVDPEVTVTEGAEGWKFTQEGSDISGTAPGGGGELSITAAETSYLQEGDFSEGQWVWRPPPRPEIWSVEFDNTSFSAVSTSEGKPSEGAEWHFTACSHGTGGISNFSPPPAPSLTLVGSRSSEYKCETPIYMRLRAGLLNEEKENTVSASFSVGAIVLSGPLLTAEEEAQEAEEDGEGNEGEPHRHKCQLGRPVDCATGNQVVSQSDLSVGGRGLGLHMVRTYNSLLAADQAEHGTGPGPFGYGWTGSYSAHVVTGSRCHLEVCTETAAVYQDNGSAVLFEYVGEKWVAESPLAQATLAKEGSGYLYTLPDQTKLYFNSSGLLTSEVDRNGNTTTMNRNTEGRLESVSAPAGRKLTLAYDGEGQVESVTDPLGHTVKYTYESGALASVTQPGEAGLRWQFKYNASQEMTSETDGREHTVSTEYGLYGRVISQTDALGRTRKWQYETTESGSETTVTEPNGSTTVEQFNSERLPTSVTRASGTSYAATTTYEYDGSSNLIAVTDPDKHTTKYGYDSVGDRTSMVNAEKDETQWTYDSTHDVKTITLPDGEMTTIVRNSNGDPETVAVAAPQETRQVAQITNYTYDSHGDLTSVTNPVRHTWKYVYDSQGDRAGETDPEGDTRSWVYNEDSQVTSIVSPRGEVKGAERSKFTTTVERDDQGRPLTVTDPLGHTTKYTYDADGNVETVIDGNGRKTKYTYDADNEPTKVEEPSGTVTESVYNSEGQVVEQYDGNRHDARYVRNLLGEVTEVIDPLGRKTTREYDDAGNMTSMTDAEKRTTTYTYDPANGLTEITYSDGKTPDVKYEYNGDGYVTKMVDGTGTTSDTFDQFDRLIESKDGHGDITKYEYNPVNQPTKITYPNGKAVTREYDKDGRLEKVNDWLSHTTKFSYDPDSNWTTTYPTTGTRGEDRYAYNDADQMTEDEMSYGTETRALLVYTRDDDGQVKTITSKGLPGETNPSYTYDSNNRLTKAGSSPWEYDAANNPIKIGTRSYAYNAADELETRGGFFYNAVGERTENTPTRAVATTYGYDQAGNLTSVKQGKEGETRAISDAYTYNGNGLRGSQASGGTTRYIAWDTAEELPQILSDETRSYIYGPENLPIEQIGSEGKALYLHRDQQGSIRMLTGTTGATEATMTYDPYGNLTGSTGSVTTPMGYDGQYTSSDTGLIYMRARNYDPATAQFTTPDPWVALTGEPYSYVADNPLTWADPTGRCGVWCVGGIVLGGVALATGAGEVAIGGGAVAEGVLGGISAVSGAVGAGVDAKECAGGSGISCVGAGVGIAATGGAGAVALGVATGEAASGATAISITAGGIGFLGDVAGAFASPNTPEGSTARGCG